MISACLFLYFKKNELYLTVLNHRAAEFYKHIVFMVYDFHVHLPPPPLEYSQDTSET
jgi:hypothetical protein